MEETTPGQKSRLGAGSGKAHAGGLKIPPDKGQQFYDSVGCQYFPRLPRRRMWRDVVNGRLRAPSFVWFEVTRHQNLFSP